MIKIRKAKVFLSLAAMAIASTCLAEGDRSIIVTSILERDIIVTSIPERDIIVISLPFTSVDDSSKFNAAYNPDTLMLHLPAVEVPESGHMMIYNADLELVADPSDILFRVTSLEPLDHHWGYEGTEGAEHWGGLMPKYALCGNGQNQSPIDISDTVSADISNIVFNYQPTPLNIINNGHTIQVNYDEGSSIEVDGTSYQLLQFHFHTLSEHTLNGQHSAMEMHLVHKSNDGNLAVVGVMMNQGSENSPLAPIWEHLPAEAGEEQQFSEVMIDAIDLLPSERHAYKYSGSLTTPPCSEGVKWLVLTTPVEVSEEQVAAFESIVGDNYRPVQSLAARTVLMDSK